MTDVFCCNPALSAERFDGEVVIIDVLQGVYFSLRGAAADLWTLFQAPRTTATAVAAFADADPAARAELSRCIETMASLQLLVSATALPDPDDGSLAPLRFAPPQVESFTDLAELIAIDPVHEVDVGAGWPVRPSGFPDPQA